MATSSDLYHHNLNRYGYVVPLDECRNRAPAMSVVIPSIPQSTIAKHRQNYQHLECNTTPMTDIKGLNMEQDAYISYQHNNNSHLVATNGTHLPSKTMQQNSGNLPRVPESLKRRPSLREAARSFRASRVAKRLRRQAKADSNPEDEADAGASASESDNSGDQMCRYKSLQAQSMDDESIRRPSVVSSLVSDLESSLSFKTHGSRDRASSATSQASSHMMDSSDAASTNTSFTSLSGLSKRSCSTEDNDQEPDDEDDSDRTGKKACIPSVLEPEQPQLFACPFAKYDAVRYSASNISELNYRGCSQSFLKDLARVKQHLYRVHERPQHHCPKCYETFKNQGQCMRHIELQSCAPRPCPFNEKMTPDQLTAIKKKNRGTDPYMGWYEIYKTLFPGAQLPLSPFAAFTANVDTLEIFMDFVSRELPSRIPNHLGFNSPIIDAISGSLPELLRQIRRDFTVAHQRLEVAPKDTPETNVQNGQATDSSTELNFHQMVTMTQARQSQPQARRPSAIDMPSNMYAFTPIQHRSMQSEMGPPPAPYHNQQQQQNINSRYTQHQQLYQDMYNSTMLQDMSSEPPITAVFQPIEHGSHEDYFTENHHSEEHLPAYSSLQIEDNEDWIPHMISTSVNHSMHVQGVQGMMDGMYHGGYNNNGQ